MHDCPQSEILCLRFLQHIFDNPAVGELHAGTGAIGEQLADDGFGHLVLLLHDQPFEFAHVGEFAAVGQFAGGVHGAAEFVLPDVAAEQFFRFGVASSN